MGGNDECPAVYVSDTTASVMVALGRTLSADVLATLLNLAHDETAVEIPTETVLRAAGLYLADHGRPDLLAEIETFLADVDLAEARC